MSTTNTGEESTMRIKETTPPPKERTFTLEVNEDQLILVLALGESLSYLAQDALGVKRGSADDFYRQGGLLLEDEVDGRLRARLMKAVDAFRGAALNRRLIQGARFERPEGDVRPVPGAAKSPRTVGERRGT